MSSGSRISVKQYGRFPRTFILQKISEGYGWEDICEMLGVLAPENIKMVRDFVGSRRRRQHTTILAKEHT